MNPQTKITVFAIVATLLLSVQVQAQTQSIAWGLNFSSSSVGMVPTGAAVKSDQNGNSYITGTIWNPTVFGAITLTTSFGGDVFISKVNPTGTVLWALKFGSAYQEEGLAIETDMSGNVYVAGLFRDTLVLGSIILSGGATIQNGFVVKLDPNGNVIWAIQTNSSIMAGFNELCLDVSGNIYVVGYFEGQTTIANETFNPVGQYDVVVIKLNSSGNKIWTKTMGGLAEDSGTDIATDPFGNVYVCGLFAGTATFDQVTKVSQGSHDSFLVRLNHNNGSVVWANQIGGWDFDMSYALCTDQQGYVYCLGLFSDDCYFESNFLTPKGDKETYIAKYSPQGGCLWAKRFGPPTPNSDVSYGRDIHVDKYGDIYTLGTFGGTITFDSSTPTTTLISSNGNHYIAKFLSNGNFLWAKQLSSGELVGLSTNPVNGNVYVTGHTSGLSQIESTQFAYKGIILFKINPDLAAGLSEGDVGEKWAVYPNPASHEIFLQCENNDELKGYVLTDVSGKVVLKEGDEINFDRTISISELDNGIYFLRINTESYSLVKKVIKE